MCVGWGGLGGKGGGAKSIPGNLVWPVWQPQITEKEKREKIKWRERIKVIENTELKDLRGHQMFNGIIPWKKDFD